MKADISCQDNIIVDKEITKLSDSSTIENFLKVIKQISGNVILLQIEDNKRVTPIYISEDFAKMMEYSHEDLNRITQGYGLYKMVYPEDRPLVRSIFKYKISYDGSKSVILQLITGSNKTIWCKINYSFIDDCDKHFLYCNYIDITKQKINEERIKNIYLKFGNSFYQNTENTLANFRINLTHNYFEEINGRDLYYSDDYSFSYSDSIKKRSDNYPIESEKKQFLQKFNRESLINDYNSGKTFISQVLLSKRPNGSFCFVKIYATFTTHPFSNDLIAFIKEQEFNKEKIENSLINKILGKQFDFVAYMINGFYNVIFGDTLNKRGNISPATTEGNYHIYLNNQVYPVLDGNEKEIEEQKAALKLELIDKELSEKSFYSVNIIVKIDNDIYYKKFDFYPINRESKYYLVLKSDTTQIQKHQLELNKQLKLALDSSRQANMAKSSFLSSISHEMRTPMNAIIGLDKLALNEPGLTSKTKDYLIKIESSANHLLSIINNILDMSRIESGRIVLKNERFSFKEIINQVNTIIKSQCEDKNIIYDSIINVNLDQSFLGDALKIKEILINILGNSVKFTNPGGKIIFIFDKLIEFNDQCNLRFIIKDNGIGIDKDFISKIFDPFSQEDSSRSTQYGSTGLGMAITKNLVELMNGKIEVESEKGKGSTFTVFLTLKKYNSAEKEIIRDNNIQVKKITDITGKRILLAEDMPINAEIIIQILKMKNIEVTHAKNGKEALDKFNESSIGYYDAIIMDIRMPILDGLLATKEIRNLNRTDAKRIPIIALTANAFEEDVQKSLQYGMNAHLIKPVEIEKLYSTLGELIQDK